MKEDNWKPFQGVDFSDEKIKSYYIDTRDFHCITSENPNIPTFDIEKKYLSEFIHSPEEVKTLLDRLFTESCGEKEWRMLDLKSSNPHVRNWQLKYIRIYRTIHGLIVSNKDSYALRKVILSADVDQEYLYAQ